MIIVKLLLINPKIQDIIFNGMSIARKFCFICNAFKKDEYTKHCFYCEKCIENFDHHCYWTNNCISKKNIITFFFFLFLIIINVTYNSYICFNSLVTNFNSFDFDYDIISEINVQKFQNDSIKKNFLKGNNSTVIVGISNFSLHKGYLHGNFNRI
jgi:hypothetical protein